MTEYQRISTCAANVARKLGMDKLDVIDSLTKAIDNGYRTLKLGRIKKGLIIFDDVDISRPPQLEWWELNWQKIPLRAMRVMLLEVYGIKFGSYYEPKVEGDYYLWTNWDNKQLVSTTLEQSRDYDSNALLSTLVNVYSVPVYRINVKTREVILDAIEHQEIISKNGSNDNISTSIDVDSFWNK